MKGCDALVDAGRRAFFTRTAAVATTVPGTPSKAAPAIAFVEYPVRRLANIKSLKVSEPLQVSYPPRKDERPVLDAGQSEPHLVEIAVTMSSFSIPAGMGALPRSHERLAHAGWYSQAGSRTS